MQPKSPCWQLMRKTIYESTNWGLSVVIIILHVQLPQKYWQKLILAVGPKIVIILHGDENLPILNFLFAYNITCMHGDPIPNCQTQYGGTCTCMQLKIGMHLHSYKREGMTNNSKMNCLQGQHGDKIRQGLYQA